MSILLRVFLAVTICGIVLEILLRTFLTAPSNHVYDDEIGFVYIPNTEIFLGSEGYARNKLNAYGLNDSEFQISKRKRALVIGDSYTEARQVKQSENFTTIAENLLNDWDVINAGRDGLHIVNSIIVANRLKEEIKPDLIILAISNGDYTEDLSHQNIIYNLDQANEINDIKLLVEKREKLKQQFQWLVHNSALFVQLIRQLKPIILEIQNRYYKIRNILWETSINAKASNLKPINTQNKIVQKTKGEMFSAIIKELQKIAPVGILYIHHIQYDTVTEASPQLLSYTTEKIISEISKQNGALYVNTLDYLLNSYHRTVFPGFGFQNTKLGYGHLNQTGHEAVGLALRDLINRYSG